MNKNFTHRFSRRAFLKMGAASAFGIALFPRQISCAALAQSKTPTYRLYLEEIGTSEGSLSEQPDNRYFCMVGVILSLEEAAKIQLQLDSIKKTFFQSNPDSPFIFQRKALVNKQPPFSALTDPALEETFLNALLKYMHSWQFTVVIAIIDKKRQDERIPVWRDAPYGNVFQILCASYIRWLRIEHTRGDILGSSRQKNEDMRLKTLYATFYEKGNALTPADKFQRYLSSRQIKIKPRSKGLAGQELAALVAYPCLQAAINRRSPIEIKRSFDAEIGDLILKEKILHSPTGEIEGYGIRRLD